MVLLDDEIIILQLGEAGSKRRNNIAVQVPLIYLNISVVYRHVPESRGPPDMVPDHCKALIPAVNK